MAISCNICRIFSSNISRHLPIPDHITTRNRSSAVAQRLSSRSVYTFQYYHNHTSHATHYIIPPRDTRTPSTTNTPTATLYLDIFGYSVWQVDMRLHTQHHTPHYHTTPPHPLLLYCVSAPHHISHHPLLLYCVVAG